MDARSTTKLHAEWHETFTSQRILSLTVTFEMSLQIKWKENTVNRIVENQLPLKTWGHAGDMCYFSDIKSSWEKTEPEVFGHD